MTPLFFWQMSCSLTVNLLVFFKSSAEIVYIQETATLHRGEANLPEKKKTPRFLVLGSFASC